MTFAVAALVVTSPEAHAQLYALSTSEGAAPASCSGGRTEDYKLGRNVATNVGCAVGPLALQAEASNVGGVLKARASASSNPGVSVYTGGGRTTGLSWWQDVLTVTDNGAAPESVLLEFLLTGSMRVAASPETSWIGFGTASADVSAGLYVYADVQRSATWSRQFAVTGRGTNANVPRPMEMDEVVSRVLSVRAPLYFDPITGTARLPFNMQLRAGAYVSSPGFVVGGSVSPFLLAMSEFGNTGRLSGIKFFGAGDAVITSGVSYGFANGTEVIPAVVTPEPGTWALFGSGLLGLAGVARRRRTAS